MQKVRDFFILVKLVVQILLLQILLIFTLVMVKLQIDMIFIVQIL
jgi:hypothetical protein